MSTDSDWRSQQDRTKSGDNNGLADGAGDDRPIVAVGEISTAPAPSPENDRTPVERDATVKTGWRLWADERPTDERAAYRWRVPERNILGMMLRPEWTAELLFCGMGYAPNEWWPGFSEWDGYKRTLPAGTEWRPALEGESKNSIFWGGLDLLPCPFTGKQPRVDYHGRWIGAPPYNAEWLRITCHLIDSHGWRDAKAMQKAWNTRPHHRSPRHV